MTPNPTILLIPGSFAPPTIYHPLITALRTASHPALVLTLPSTQKRHPLPPATMHDDASLIRAVTEALIAQGKQVVVVCHSYGGVPTSEALVGLGVGKEGGGGVRRIVYFTAVVPRVGERQVDAVGMAGGMVEGAVDGYMHTAPHLLAQAIGNDLPTWEEAYELASLLPHHSAASFTEAVTRVAYESIPASYILCERDFIISPELQEGFIGVLREGGREVGVVRLDAGHCANWSRVGEVVGGILGEAGRV
ncbi:alpha/beta-hydrolase [Dothidotthia symphoricarpi CBS 119687]|uniref:Alpha/beta-hydrolase n=1 Tax=Dothidotthia symphoricarpi CBS 119687 TaxID=1392245 RepID=A0A6A6A3T4_9PLEO|nr:alpha/beta-hydrolase [Dothidotthia symphoricarpi CBS 119687]KAF2125813.1 alpha/beta-hydrolase [Dothidotthia symphoricarpi CBS 119687]